MTDDQFGDPVNDEAWPIPPACSVCNSDSKAYRDTYCVGSCQSCIRRHFAPPTPKLSLWQRVKVWLVGRQEGDE